MGSFRYLFQLVVFSGLPFMLLSGTDSQKSADLKIKSIEMNHWPRSRAIFFSDSELVTLGMSELSRDAPGAVSRPSLKLHVGGGVVSAVMDFDRLQKLSRSGSSGSNWLMSRLLAGQHDVSVSVEITSAKGLMTVHPTEVDIGGVKASGTMLDFLINHLVMPYYPQAVINRPFRLSNNLDRVTVSPAGATVYRK
jgi:hypothetical protein